jgi:hypothetical protein
MGESVSDGSGRGAIGMDWPMALTPMLLPLGPRTKRRDPNASKIRAIGRIAAATPSQRNGEALGGGDAEVVAVTNWPPSLSAG